ncbi:MAG: hypothetical protein PVH12_07090 [Candidatus Bathyarchaeota archaeon]|jgi:hypothetical protein
MDYGKYAKYSVVTLCGILLFFLGSSFPFQTELMNIFSFSIIVILTVAISYRNGSPTGGFFLGLFTSTSFLVGFFLMTIILELSTMYSTGPLGELPGLSFLLSLFSSHGLGMVSMVVAFASMGLFFGLLGYIFGRTLPIFFTQKQPYLFRDYWSNIYSLGKNERREYPYLDRKPSTWIRAREKFWRAIIEKIAEPQPDLAFVPSRTGEKSSKSSFGNVFDLISGRMIGNNVVDPSDLTSKYRPLVLKVARLSTTPKGVRRLAFETLISRFLAKFLNSWLVWLFYLSISTLLLFAAYVIQPSNPQIFISPIVYSAATLFFVWRWRKISPDLFERRPDERVLIFIVYIVLALLFGFYFESLMRPPTSPETWLRSWFIWTRWMLLLSLLLGLAYVFIHREVEVTNTYYYDNSKPATEPYRFTGYRDAINEPYWLKQDNTKAYWVLRFMYFWKYEITRTPHSDWERVEIWIDAEEGKPKWVVTDYHYRELWYRVEGELPLLYTTFFINFHSPIPITDSNEVMTLSHIFGKTSSSLAKTVVTGTVDEIVENLEDFFERLSKSFVELHPGEWISSFGLSERAANFCSKLPWIHWRYPHGVENLEKYLSEPIVKMEDQPKH